MTEVFRIGAITFDDIAAVKVLTLPSNCKDDVPITFHDEAGADYQVPAGKKFIVGLVWVKLTANTILGRIGPSNAADGALTAEMITLSVVTANTFEKYEPIGVFAAGKYVTGETNSEVQEMGAGTVLYGAEISV